MEELQKQLKKQQEQVTKPLIQQVVLYKQDQDRRKDNQAQMSIQIRMLMAILRFPSLCEEFRRAAVQNLSKEENKKK